MEPVEEAVAAVSERLLNQTESNHALALRKKEAWRREAAERAVASARFASLYIISGCGMQRLAVRREGLVKVVERWRERSLLAAEVAGLGDEDPVRRKATLDRLWGRVYRDTERDEEEEDRVFLTPRDAPHWVQEAAKEAAARSIALPAAPFYHPSETAWERRSAHIVLAERDEMSGMLATAENRARVAEGEAQRLRVALAASLSRSPGQQLDPRGITLLLASSAGITSYSPPLLPFSPENRRPDKDRVSYVSNPNWSYVSMALSEGESPSPVREPRERSPSPSPSLKEVARLEARLADAMRRFERHRGAPGRGGVPDLAASAAMLRSSHLLESSRRRTPAEVPASLEDHGTAPLQKLRPLSQQGSREASPPQVPAPDLVAQRVHAASRGVSRGSVGGWEEEEPRGGESLELGREVPAGEASSGVGQEGVESRVNVSIYGNNQANSGVGQDGLLEAASAGLQLYKGGGEAAAKAGGETALYKCGPPGERRGVNPACLNLNQLKVKLNS